MVGSSVHGAFLEVQQRINQRIMKRNNSSAEDMVRSMMKPVLDRSSIEATRPNIAAWRIADRSRFLPPFPPSLQFQNSWHCCHHERSSSACLKVIGWRWRGAARS